MKGIAKIIWSSVGIAIMAGLMTAAVVWGYHSRPSDKPCAGIEYIIEDRAERMYLTEKELTGMLDAQDLYPVGKELNKVALQRIENAILHHPMVRTAECYLTPKHIVRVHLTQRVPVVRVQTAVDTYLIDRDRKVMPIRSSVRDHVLVATGNVGVQIAGGQIADFAEWTADEPYWRERIHHLYVQTPKMIYLYLKDEKGVKEERIVLGSLKEYEKKLKKLKTFYLNSPQEVKDKHYTELDLRYEGQVIGRY